MTKRYRIRPDPNPKYDWLVIERKVLFWWLETDFSDSKSYLTTVVEYRFKKSWWWFRRLVVEDLTNKTPEFKLKNGKVTVV